MVVLWCARGVAGAVVAGVEFTYEVQICQQLEGTVDGYQTDTGVLLADLLKNCRRCKVVRAGGKGMYHRTSLRSELVAMPPEGDENTSNGKLHTLC